MQRACGAALSGLIAAATATCAAAPAAMPQPAPTACGRAAESILSEAVAEARRYVSERWLQIGENFYIAYRMRSPPANPFDLTRPREMPKEFGKPVGKESEEGYIWIGGLQCRVTGVEAEEIVVTFTAGAASFIEKKGTWTPPMRQRELTQIVVTRSGPHWIARERRSDYALLAADDELRRPLLEEIPLRSKRLGIPCDARQAWNGKRCTAVRPN